MIKGRPVIKDQGKTDAATRTLTISADVQAVIADHLMVYNSPLVFPNSKGGLPFHGAVRKSLKLQASRAGVPIITPHDLRASLTIATMAQHNQLDLYKLSRDLGHTNPNFTMAKYGHLIERYQERKVYSLGELLGLPGEPENDQEGALN